MPDSIGGEDTALPERRPASEAVERRLPGRARPQATALREYRAFLASGFAHLPPPLLRLLGLEPEDLFRWRVQLDCDCVTEVLTGGDRTSPAEGRWPAGFFGGSLPPGRMVCVHEDSPPAEYRDITAWGDREVVSFPADPVEPRHGLDPHTWALLRHDEPHSVASWRVTLSCGHRDMTVSDLDWKPEDGPVRADAGRLREMLAGCEEMWASQPDLQGEREREHTRRMLEAGWPLPCTEALCYTCPAVRSIVAFQRVGWLVPRAPKSAPTTPSAQPSRTALENHLRQAQTRVDTLQEQLLRLDQQEEVSPQDHP